MTTWKCVKCIAALALMASVCHAAIGASSDDGGPISHAVSPDASGDDTATIPDFDGDGTIGFGDFVILAGAFGSRQGDEKFANTLDLNNDGEIGFSDFVIFAQNFGKEAPSPVVAIPDANLRAAIEAAMGKDSGASITSTEMATLDSLDASELEITELTGLQAVVNLTYLSLNDNRISNISALASLTGLERLWISNNGIEDISALAKLNNLTELWLWNNLIEDISALSGLTGLTTLSLGRNNITDISALSNLIRLRMLILKGNRISDLAPLAANKGLDRGATVDVTDNPLNAASESTHIPALQARGVSVSFVPSPAVTIPDANLRAAIASALGKASGAPITQADMRSLDFLNAGARGISDLKGLEAAANLTELLLFENNITDISPLSELINLRGLIIWGNRITDVSPFSDLINLERLSIGQNSVTDISPLSRLTSLKSLSVGDANITDLTVLAGMTNLRDLSLLGAHIQNEDLSLLSGLTQLTSLGLSHNQISDISPLMALTDLTRLWLWDNQIADISALSRLTGMEFLSLGKNNVSDISALSDLTKLTELYLNENKITDLSPLAGLTNLTFLDLALNNVVDISPLAGLTSLVTLNLAANRITDIAALSGLTNLRDLDLRGNPYESLARGDFDIELVFLDSFSESQKNVLQYVARRWMAVIRDDVPDFQFAAGWSGRCGGRSFNIPPGERIDDLRIYVSKWEGGSALGYGSPILLREASHLPVLGCMAFELSHANLLITGLHEIGHVLGFASEVWNEFDFYQNPLGDTHFSGPLATAAFDKAGGRAYNNSKVPLQKGESHWRGTVFGDELMTRIGTGSLSAITVQSMADIGYGVDVTQADPYLLPGASAGARIAATTPPVPGSGAIGYRPGIVAQSDADRYGQGSIEGRLPLGLAHSRTGRLESAERVWDARRIFNLTGDRQTWSVALPSLSAPEQTCGAGLINEPIYVADPHGRIVRTIGQ